MLLDNYNVDFFIFFGSDYQACFLGTLAYKFGCLKGSLEFFLEHSIDLCSCSLFYTKNYLIFEFFLFGLLSLTSENPSLQVWVPKGLPRIYLRAQP